MAKHECRNKHEVRMTKSERAGAAAAGTLVVCLHGLGRTQHCWWLLRRRLEGAGYRTDAWTYPSIGKSIEELGRDCGRRLAVYRADPTIRRIHVVTHSLGGIVARYALRTVANDPGARGWSKLGGVVMLAPPNGGSSWARRLGPWLGWLAPALPQLSDAPDSFVNQLKSEKGEVRGEKCGEGAFPNPRFFVVAAAKDGKCPLATTHLQGEAAHIVVRGGHTLIMYRRDVAGAVLGFLEQFNGC